MGQFSISITKEVGWRARQERFSNVYTYDDTFAINDEATVNNVVDSLVAAEKRIHSSQVSFREARAWSSGGTAQENELISIRDLSGTGSATEEVDMDREACYVVKFECDRDDSRGRKVFLRKWVHACSLLGGVATWKAGNQLLSGPQVTALTEYAEVVYDPTALNIDLFLISPTGRRANGNIEIFQYPEHHEFTY